LIEDGPKGRPELAHGGHHPRERRLAVLELLCLGQEAVGLDRITEPRGCLIAPGFEGSGLGEPVEAVVDLDRVELARVECEPAFRWQVWRIERSAPVLIDPPRTTDPYRSGEVDVVRHALATLPAGVRARSARFGPLP